MFAQKRDGWFWLTFDNGMLYGLWHIVDQRSLRSFCAIHNVSEGAD